LETYLNHRVIHWNKELCTSSEHKLICEEPLSIRVQGKPYSVVMRTPGDELAHAAGFCLAEGIADTPDDFNTLSYCNSTNSNIISVTISKSRQSKIGKLLDRRGFISQTSCGICGKEIVKDLYQIIQPIRNSDQIDGGLALEIQPIRNSDQIDGGLALECLENLSSHQPLRDQTRASHAAVLYTSDFKLLSVAEDVGRHNALDKAIGKLFLEHKLDQASLLILSSRISYELVQKAARARIPVILAFSRPTSLAMELASKLNMTIGCLAQNSGLYIFCGENRLIR